MYLHVDLEWYAVCTWLEMSKLNSSHQIKHKIVFCIFWGLGITEYLLINTYLTWNKSTNLIWNDVCALFFFSLAATWHICIHQNQSCDVIFNIRVYWLIKLKVKKSVLNISMLAILRYFNLYPSYDKYM